MTQADSRPVAVVTGAGRGVGRAHALALAAAGYAVVVNDLDGAGDGSGADLTPAQQVVDEIKAAGGEAIVMAIVLLMVASGFAYAGKRLRAPLAITRPGATVAGFMIAIWLLAIYTVGVAWTVYQLQLKLASS